MREETKKSVAFNHNKVGFLGLLVTLGIVFGDIGTLPHDNEGFQSLLRYCSADKVS